MLKGRLPAIKKIKDLRVSEGKNGTSQGRHQRDMLSFISNIIEKLDHLHDLLALIKTFSPVDFERKARLPKYIFIGLQMGESEKENPDAQLVTLYLLPDARVMLILKVLLPTPSEETFNDIHDKSRLFFRLFFS